MQIVISTTADKSQTLAFSYASLALNNSFFLHHLVRPQTTHPRLSQLTHKPLQKPPMSPAQNHESALTDKTLNPWRTQTLGRATLLSHRSEDLRRRRCAGNILRR